MIYYKVSCVNAHRHFIKFEAEFPTHQQSKVLLQLPSWRPGRYELGNFAKNIRAWHVADKSGKDLMWNKVNKDLWEVNAEGLDTIILKYEYYAADLNAGSTYLDNEQLYINPVNCFFYNHHDVQSDYRIEFDLPSSFQIACGLGKSSTHVLTAANFDELADCPLIASASLRHLDYAVEGITYHLWIQGDVKLDEPRLINEFVAFTKSQIRIFKDIPCKEYHFLFQFTPYFLRHGVEHRNSTVIAMGPAADFQSDVLFKDLLGISCHELFHTWNIKKIRPADMLPYDFTKENYSKLGYVYEGVTTYYGDLLLWRVGSINDNEWLQVIEERLQDYFDNAGRFNLSVADSSFDTWLDGYSNGIPWRKVSIYNEGFLIALIIDIMIIRATSGNKSLDDVMSLFYERFGKKDIGYTEADYKSLLEEVSGLNFDEVFEKLINGTHDYLPYLIDGLNEAGLTMHVLPAAKWSEAYLGMSVEENGQKVTVQSVIENSTADKAGFWNGDDIVAINGNAPYKNFHILSRMNNGDALFHVMRKGKLEEIHVSFDGNIFGKKYKLARIEQPTDRQLSIFEKWKFS